MPPIFIGGSPAGIFLGCSFGGPRGSAEPPVPQPLQPPPQQLLQQSSQQSRWKHLCRKSLKWWCFSQQQSQVLQQVLQLVVQQVGAGAQQLVVQVLHVLQQ